MLPLHPRLPPANVPARPGADMDMPPGLTHVPAQPTQRHHTSTSTHRSPGKARAHAWCPNPPPITTRRTQHPTPAPEAQGPPRPPQPSPLPPTPQPPPLLPPHPPPPHILIQHSTPQASGETSQTGPQTPPHREQPRRRQGPRPDEARTRNPAETQDRRQTASQTRQRDTTATRSQTQTHPQARRHDSSASPTPRERPL